MSNKRGILLTLGGIASAGIIITWLMYGGEAPSNKGMLDNVVVNAIVKNTTIQREQNGKLLWKFSVEELENLKLDGKAILKGVQGKVYRNDGSVLDVNSGGGIIAQEAETFALDRGVKAKLSSGGTLNAEKVEWNQAKDVITATGNVKVVRNNQMAKADKIITNGALKRFKLIGNAEIKKGGDVVE